MNHKAKVFNQIHNLTVFNKILKKNHNKVNNLNNIYYKKVNYNNNKIFNLKFKLMIKINKKVNKFNKILKHLININLK